MTLSERIRRHTLSEAEVGPAVNLLVALLASVRANGQVALTTHDGTAVAMPSAAQEILLDSLSLLASRRKATLVAIDPDGLLAISSTTEWLGTPRDAQFRSLVNGTVGGGNPKGITNGAVIEALARGLVRAHHREIDDAKAEWRGVAETYLANKMYEIPDERLDTFVESQE